MSRKPHRRLRRTLQTLCRQAFPAVERPRVPRLDRVVAGAETETYFFDLESGPVGEPRRESLVLRRYARTHDPEVAHREWETLHRLRRAGYPAPEPKAFRPGSPPWRVPLLVLDRVDGEVLSLLLGRADEARRGELLDLFADLLARLHDLDPAPFESSSAAPRRAEDPRRLLDGDLARTRVLLQRRSLRGFLPVLDWLETHRETVPVGSAAVLHGDFHPHNVLVGPGNAATVVDWSRCHVSDPRFDLAWAMLLLRTQAAPAWSEHVRRRYEHRSGARVEGLGWFEVWACATRLAAWVVAGRGWRRWIGRGGRGVAPPTAGLRKTYEILLERTSVRVPEAESTFAR